MTLTIVLAIFYIITAIINFHSFITLKENNFYVSFFIFIGFFFLALGPLIFLIAHYLHLYNKQVIFVLLFIKLISMIYLMKASIGIRRAITEGHHIQRRKWLNIAFVFLEVTLGALLVIFFLDDNITFTDFPIATSSLRLNILIAAIDVIAMSMAIIHIPPLKEGGTIIAGSILYMLAALSLLASTIFTGFNFRLLTQHILIINPIVNTGAFISMYINKHKTLKDVPPEKGGHLSL